MIKHANPSSPETLVENQLLTHISPAELAHMTLPATRMLIQEVGRHGIALDYRTPYPDIEELCDAWYERSTRGEVSALPSDPTISFGKVVRYGTRTNYRELSALGESAGMMPQHEQHGGRLVAAAGLVDSTASLVLEYWMYDNGYTELDGHVSWPGDGENLDNIQQAWEDLALDRIMTADQGHTLFITEQIGPQQVQAVTRYVIEHA